ncbi:hypothetical protein E4U41_002119 [Claviceps citrina]|nr:hypothetical protein E4U41_002119 [Claviceps citrina]
MVGVGAGMEPLACVVCRSRKLKCDRAKPACARCRGVGGECVYPEARRKPTFKRRNVKEIEARLAQVEGYLQQQVNKDIGERRQGPAPFPPPELSSAQGDFAQGDFLFDSAPAGLQDPPSQAQPAPGFGFDDYAAPQQQDGFQDGSSDSCALMALGYSESLPPFDVQEELNNAFFLSAHHLIPVIHSGRFYLSFYGHPLRKPPMSLQYAMWAMAATGHAKYDQYADIFYRRARHYMEADEMKASRPPDCGEHFITIPHAQALCLCAAFEAKMMLFTRAATTCAKAVRLCQMMGLDRLDGAQDDLPPCLGPHTSWAELEERRRVFWGIFATDSHASISTGWPALINSEDTFKITTRLPASEEAFASGREEASPFLEQVFSGSSYSAFAGTSVVCQIFRVILKHVHRCKPSDRPEDMLAGPFWSRHRDLDNRLSSTFMFLPAQFVLPRAVRDPGAMHMNLNLHAAVIILHHAALEKVEQHGLPASVMEASLCRLRTSAEQIVNIVKMTSHFTSLFKSPLCALSLYCCTTVYVYLAKKRPGDGFTASDRSNLEIVVQAMEVVGRKHEITCAFLQQACLDIERNDLAGMLRFPVLSKYRALLDGSNVGSNIPLITRSSVSRHSKVTPVLPGRLPLSDPQGRIAPGRLVHAHDDAVRSINTDCFQPVLGAVTRNVSSGTARATGQENKRRRMSPDASAAAAAAAASSSSSSTSASFVLPDRTSSSTTSSPAQGAPPDHHSSSSPDLTTTTTTITTPPHPPGLGNSQGHPPAWHGAQMHIPDSLFTCSVPESLFGMRGYDDAAAAVPTSWDAWAETMAWGGDEAMPGPSPGPVF